MVIVCISIIYSLGNLKSHTAFEISSYLSHELTDEHTITENQTCTKSTWMKTTIHLSTTQNPWVQRCQYQQVRHQNSAVTMSNQLVGSILRKILHYSAHRYAKKNITSKAMGWINKCRMCCVHWIFEKTPT